MAASELMDGKGRGRAYRRRDGRLLESIIGIADADSDDDYHRAWTRFFKTLTDLGWRAPDRET
jgi:hypothetical protein